MYTPKNYRRPVALTLLSVGVLLSFQVAHSYSTMVKSQNQLTLAWQKQQKSPSAPPLLNAVTRVSIPKIDLDVMVLEGASRSSLLNGAGHLDDTSAPAKGGHRGAFFRNLGSLGRGDDIFVHRAGRDYHYVVKRKAVVEANDVAVVDPSPQNRLTLVTCYPPHYAGLTPQRLVVIAERIDGTVAN
jgi:sortase A